jgi:hypothetical protein
MRIGLMQIAAIAAAGVIAGCSSSSSSGTSGSSGSSGTSGSQTLYNKYGEDAGMWTVVTDAVGGLLADPNEAPYFTNVLGKPGHDTPQRLEGCLVLQFATVMGAPGAAYPGKNQFGDTCEDMNVAHQGLGVPGPVFDKFIMDVGSVLQKDHVDQVDINTLAGVLTSLKGQVVQPPPQFFLCDGGAAPGADGGPGFTGNCQ